jgi:hypothetical protein
LIKAKPAAHYLIYLPNLFITHTGKQTTKTWFGLEKYKENWPKYQRLLLLTVLPLNYFMVAMLSQGSVE